LSTLLSRLTPAAIGLALPSGTGSVKVRTDPPVPGGVKVVALLEDPGGRVAAQELVAERPGSDTYAGPTGEADRLLSLVLTAEPPSGVPLRRAGFDVTFEGLSLLGSFSDRIVPLSTWRGLDTSGQTVAISPVGSDGIRA